MQQYLEALHEVYSSGSFKKNRAGGAISRFGLRIEVDLKDGFPLLTTKQVNFKAVAEELFWFLSGSTNVKDLQRKGVHIWDEWANKDTGELGNIYGKQWRNWNGVDQISELISGLQTFPESNRHILSAWNVADVHDGLCNLPPCHILAQFYVSPDNRRLSCQVYQRSADMFLGVPFNIASYALLTHLIAQQIRRDVGALIWIGGDCHIYTNHLGSVDIQLNREQTSLPTLIVNNKASIFDYCFSDLKLVDYKPHPPLKEKVNV